MPERLQQGGGHRLPRSAAGAANSDKAARPAPPSQEILSYETDYGPCCNGGGAENSEVVALWGVLELGWGLEVEILEGLNGLVGVAPAAGGVVEALVGEEVLIDGVEGGFAAVVEAVGVGLDGCGGVC